MAAVPAMGIRRVEEVELCPLEIAHGGGDGLRSTGLHGMSGSCEQAASQEGSGHHSGRLQLQAAVVCLQCSAVLYRMKQSILETMEDGGRSYLLCFRIQAGVRSFMSPNVRQTAVIVAAAASDLNQSKLVAELDGQ